MGGKVLEYEAKAILQSGIKQGKIQGKIEGRIEGKIASIMELFQMDYVHAFRRKRIWKY